MLPYQNLSLEDMPGEVWKDIPEWEGYYQVSNFARAKSVARINIHKDGSVHFIKERIRKQSGSGPGRKYLGFSSYGKGAPRRIVCIYPDGTEKTFASIHDASLAGFCERSILCCIKGKYSHHHGCKWRYAD